MSPVLSPCAVLTVLAKPSELKRLIKKWIKQAEYRKSKLDASPPGPSRPKDSKLGSEENSHVLVGWNFLLLSQSFNNTAQKLKAPASISPHAHVLFSTQNPREGCSCTQSSKVGKQSEICLRMAASGGSCLQGKSPPVEEIWGKCSALKLTHCLGIPQGLGRGFYCDKKPGEHLCLFAFATSTGLVPIREVLGDSLPLTLCFIATKGAASTVNPSRGYTTITMNLSPKVPSE